MSSDKNNEPNKNGFDFQASGAKPKKLEPRVAKKTTASASTSSPKSTASVTRRQTRSLQKEASGNSDPNANTCEKKKGNRKAGNSRRSGAVYDEYGRHIATGLDMCDCFTLSCPGCHFPCPKCKSPKCGPVCRVNRKFTYEQIEFHGSDLVIKNPLNSL